MSINENAEFYPVTVHYRDAEMPGAPGQWLNVHGRDPRNYRTDMIHGLYRIGEHEVLEIGMQISDFPSFCGGSWAHSPVARIARGGVAGGWGNVNRVPLSSGGVPFEELDNLIDLREHYDVSSVTTLRHSDTWQQYGYRILANGMITGLLSRGKRGVVLSGPVDPGEGVAEFAKALREVSHVRRVQSTVGEARLRPEEGNVGQFLNRYLRAGCPAVHHPVDVDVQEAPAWVNSNSGRRVRWYPVVISSPCIGYDTTDARGGWSRDDGCDYAHSVWQRLSEDEQAMFGNYVNMADLGVTSPEASWDYVTGAEQSYLDVAHKYIRRFHWSN